MVELETSIVTLGEPSLFLEVTLEEFLAGSSGFLGILVSILVFWLDLDVFWEGLGFPDICREVFDSGPTLEGAPVDFLVPECVPIVVLCNEPILELFFGPISNSVKAVEDVFEVLFIPGALFVENVDELLTPDAFAAASLKKKCLLNCLKTP